jgi:hypothetical protein
VEKVLNHRGYHRRFCNNNNNKGEGLKLLNTTIGNEWVHKYRTIGTINNNKRIAATMYSLGTLFVSGIYV